MCKVVCGEAASVDTSVVSNWKSKLSTLLEGYSPDCVYNVDETGLFYRCLPNCTLTFKGEACHGGKLSKERLTLLLGANMDGSDKLEPLVIGKSANPRCFRGIRSVPLPYEANKSAWMTSIVWTKWIKGFNSKMKHLHKKVILFIDDCPGHPKVDNLSHVTVQYDVTKMRNGMRNTTNIMSHGRSRVVMQHHLSRFAARRLAKI